MFRAAKFVCETVVLLLAFSALGIGKLEAQQPRAYQLQGDYAFTHDPSIAKDGGTYYVFATGKAPEGGQFPMRCSEDAAVMSSTRSLSGYKTEVQEQRNSGPRISLSRTACTGFITLTHCLA